MLVKGQFIKAKLIEAVEENRWIVSFEGDLLQVQNSTPIVFEEGKTLTLKVQSLNPFKLQVVSKARTSFDRTV